MEIQEIALYLGYIQPTNFTRAFKNGQVKHRLHLERINNVDQTKYLLLS